MSITMRRTAIAARENPSVGKNVRRVLGLGILAGAAYAVWRKTASRTPAPVGGWEPQPFPFPPQPVADATIPWVEPAQPPGQGEAGERHLPRAGRRQLRPHPAGPLLPLGRSRRGRRPARVEE